MSEQELDTAIQEMLARPEFQQHRVQEHIILDPDEWWFSRMNASITSVPTDNISRIAAEQSQPEEGTTVTRKHQNKSKALKRGRKKKSGAEQSLRWRRRFAPSPEDVSALFTYSGTQH